MIIRRRPTSLVVAFLAASTIILGAAPAGAADDDDGRVTIELSSGTVAVGGSKQVTFTITNISDVDLPRPVLEFVEPTWDHDQVDFLLDEETCTAGKWIGPGCPLEPDPLPPGRSLTYTTTLAAVEGATPGPAGRLRVLFVAALGGDPTDFAYFPLSVVAGPAPDLYASAKDVPEAGVVDPGGEAALNAVFANQGDVPATDVTFTATVPKGATFLRGQPVPAGCDLGTRKVTCDFGDDVLPVGSGLIPASFLVRVDDDAKPGVPLKGGRVTITGRAATEAELRRAARAVFPAPVADADLADNDDEFRIMVSGTPVKEEGGGGSGGGGALPITGAGGTAGTGLAFVTLGVGLVLLGRRRREGVR